MSRYTSDSSSEEEDLLSTSEEELLSSSEESDSSFFNDEEEEESDESSSDDEGGRSGPSYFLKKSFLKGSAGDDSDEESDDEGRKVVKSAKEKLLDDMKSSIEVINSNKYTNNWNIVLNEFEKFGRFLIRCNQTNIGTPRFFIKLLTSLDNSITETSNNEKDDKTLKADEARAFNTLRQRIKKQIKEFQVYYDLYKESPEEFDDNEDEPLESLKSVTQDEANDEGAAGSGIASNRVLSPVFHTLKVISESRGKKNIDKAEQVSTLEGLLETHATTGSPFELISIYQMLLSVRFDASSNQAFMPTEQWHKNEQDLGRLLDLLEANVSKYQVSELGTTTDDIDIEPTPNAEGVKVIFGSITSSIDRLDDEFTKSLQNTDPHSTDYVERLKDETTIYNLIVRGQAYIESITPKDLEYKSEQLARIILRRLEHIYYKPNQLIEANEEEAWKHIKKDSYVAAKGSTPEQVINGLSKFLQEQVNEIYGKHAILFSIYYYAVNNDYQKAKELFLSSHFYANINNAESSLQVQYNRALVQLGLSAFRSGYIDESHKILNEVVNSQRAKELLGQGFISKFPNQATLVEKQKLLPFHQHINLELLECVFMTSSLLIEIPALAAIANNHKDSKRKNASLKSFKSKLEFHDRQFFTGPPESIKDHIVHASIALQKGDWLKSYNLLSSIKIWRLFPNTDELLVMMKNKLQIEGLRTYIFTYKSVFSKLSIEKLSKIFELAGEEIASILSKMIESGDIAGEIIDNKFITFASTTEPQRSKLQELAIVLNEKIQLLAEKNEKTQSNGYGKKQQNPNQNQNQNQNQSQNQNQQQNQNQNQQQQPQSQQQQPQSQQQQQSQQPNNTVQDEFSNKFRYANVNSNNDEFQATA
ncbi:NIP1 Eukaryotic translation initiation factor 3 subunit C [Candida maltosa Xu316]